MKIAAAAAALDSRDHCVKVESKVRTNNGLTECPKSVSSVKNVMYDGLKCLKL